MECFPIVKAGGGSDTARMITLLIATRNRHKVEEIQAILGNANKYITLNEFPDAPEVVEDADSFAGNAAKKADELAHWIAESQNVDETFGPDGRVFVLADDSGLEVDALDGAPGVYSARYAALETGASGNSPDAENKARLLRELKDIPADARTGRFRCVIAILETAPGMAFETTCFDGACEGRIEAEPKGEGGFGYDPLFVPDGFKQTFAELGEETKNQLSHRARALEKLKPWLERQETSWSFGPLKRD